MQRENENQAVMDNYSTYRRTVNLALEHLKPCSTNKRLDAAIGYALFPGGKRLRPILCLLAGECVGQPNDPLLAASAAVELLHTASLIYDDLPCMDNASERHGKPALHLAFDHGVAVLAAHSMVSMAFNRIASAGIVPERTQKIIAEIARCIGPAGMAAGQARDLEGCANLDETTASELCGLKTGCLFRAACYCGAVANGSDESTARVLSRFGLHIGIAFQIADDLRDCAREDNPERSANHVLVSGREKSKAQLTRQVALALEAIARIPSNDRLRDFAAIIGGLCNGGC